MKKQRGLKRYYERLATQNAFDKITWLNLADPNTWFDNWHIHFDKKGYGNNSLKEESHRRRFKTNTNLLWFFLLFRRLIFL